MRNTFLIGFVSLIFISSCELREISLSSDISAELNDVTSDTDALSPFPSDICPDNYQRNDQVLFPAPKISFGTLLRIAADSFRVSIKDNDRLKDFFDEFSKFNNDNNGNYSNGAEIQVHSFSGLNELFKKCNFTYPNKGGAYYLKISNKENVIFIYIVADELEGLYNAAKSISQLIYKKSLVEMAIYDFPDVKFRGVAEAFYGKPWDQKDRIDAITYLAMLRYNIFLYSPKSDPYAWAMWRTPFDENEENKLREIARHSKRLGIIPCYGVGPGYDIKFSNSKDYTTLLYKYRKLIDFGFDSCLVLAFDDTQKILSDEDKSKFSDIAEAQVYIARRLYEDIKRLKPDILLAFVPNDYTTRWAKEDTYLKKISDGLRGLYKIAWTGVEVVSPEITEEDLIEIESIIKDTPILADNYPVSDLMFNGGASFLGPIMGREAQIFKKIDMYASNPMRYAISSIIPLGTIADMLWTPYRYESEHAFRESIKFFARNGRENDIYKFATNLRSSLITDIESPELKVAIDNFLSEIVRCESVNYNILRRDFFDRFEEMDEILMDSSDNRFMTEMKPWINKLKDYGRAGNFALELIEKRCRGEEISSTEINWLKGMIDALKENKYRICADIMNKFLDTIYERVIQ
ncbi:MAG: beta-N-acetylglucosaminidase domain-containing protein [Myxococcota bacterium]